MVKYTLDENSIFDTSGIADTRFADHSGDIQHGYELGSLTRGLVAYYPMDEGQGRVLHDGALDNLGQINGASWNGSGQVGSDALSFDGSNDGVDTGITSLEPPTSVALWVQLDTTATDSYHFSNENGTNSDLALLYNNSAGTFDFICDSGSAGVTVRGNSFSSTGTWVHLVGTINNDGSRVLYQDGTSVSSTTDSNTTYDSGNSFTIGQKSDNTGYHSGLIDDVRVYDRALSQPEVEVLAGLTQPQGALVEEHDLPTYPDSEAIARYEFESDVTDSWGDNDGVDNTSAGFVDGVYGQAKGFDGTDDYVTLPSFDNFSSYTISAWVNLDTPSDGDRDTIISVEENNNIRLSEQNDGNVTLRQVDINGTGHNISASISADTWTNFVATWGGSSMKLYKNGKLYGTESVSTNESVLRQTEIGAQHTGGNGRYWDGDIDDVRLYDRSLDPIEVERLFNLGAYRINRSQL